MEGDKKIITIDLPNLPEDLLIHEILPRLSVKSLLRFKCVYKIEVPDANFESFLSVHEWLSQEWLFLFQYDPESRQSV
ncbi:hypothetical protein LguiB_031454 [Lonicera macranthoides]